MEADIREFLRRFSAAELTERKILSKDHYLWGPSVKPLTELMTEHGIARLEAKERNWFLNVDGTWSNPGSKSSTGQKAGDMDMVRGIFNAQNSHLNPFRLVSGSDDHLDDDTEEPETKERTTSDELEIGEPEIRFGLERDLQRALRTNIAQLEPGLIITDGGSEKTVEAGRIDITTEDTNDNIVVIELKAGTAQPDAIPQLLAYMGTIENPDCKPVRGILVANDFAPRVVQAAKAVPNISLKAYSFQFSFQDR